VTRTIGPLHVFRHRLGTPQSEDVLVYEEMDTGWFTSIEESASGRFCIIASGNQETSEQWLIERAEPYALPRLVAVREIGVRYSVDDRGEELFIRTNDGGAIDFRIDNRAARHAGARPLASADPASPGNLCARRCRSFAGHLVRLSGPMRWPRS
jgi:oligopeptidase B